MCCIIPQSLRFVGVLMLLALGTTPIFAADNLCNFRGKGLSLNFGLIDPSIIQNISKLITVQSNFADQAGDCNKGADMTVAIVGSNTRQLVNGNNKINYTISGLPKTLARPGNAKFVTWFTPGQLQGTILWGDYANAPAGDYTDNVTISVNP